MAETEAKKNDAGLPGRAEGAGHDPDKLACGAPKVSGIYLASFAFQKKAAIVLNKIEIEAGAGCSVGDRVSWFHVSEPGQQGLSTEALSNASQKNRTGRNFIQVFDKDDDGIPGIG